MLLASSLRFVLREFDNQDVLLLNEAFVSLVKRDPSSVVPCNWLCF